MNECIIEFNFMDAETFATTHDRICYCEALIKPNGMVTYAVPSHQQALLRLYMEKYNLTEDDVWNELNVEDSPNEIMAEDLNIVQVWYDFYVPTQNMTPEQVSSINILKKYKCIIRG